MCRQLDLVCVRFIGNRDMTQSSIPIIILMSIDAIIMMGITIIKWSFRIISMVILSENLENCWLVFTVS